MSISLIPSTPVGSYQPTTRKGWLLMKMVSPTGSTKSKSSFFAPPPSTHTRFVLSTSRKDSSRPPPRV